MDLWDMAEKFMLGTVIVALVAAVGVGAFLMWWLS